MKQKIRSINLYKLNNESIPSDLANLSSAMDFVESIFSQNFTLKTDSEHYPDMKFYFINDEVIYIIDEHTQFWFNYTSVWYPISLKLDGYTDTKQLLYHLVTEKLGIGKHRVMYMSEKQIKEIEEFFKTIK